ncbi:MAG: ABC transporter permease subunit [Acidobacteria bacterium]|nr:ABC transporter permease subunit [Acidobacteriota bacterium]
MAVYEHNYKPYEGVLTAGWSRFLVIPRYVYQDLFKYKLFIALFVLCFVCPLVYTILIYLHHNTSALTFFGISSADVVPINGFFFKVFTTIQTSLAFIFTVIIGPVLISRDLANNALPLYLSRPFSRWEYIFGKLSVLLILLSVITWVPGLLLFLFQSYLEGGSWMINNFWIARGIFMISLVWAVSLGLLALAFSAWIKWRTAASAALFAIFIIPTPIGFAIQAILGTTKGHLLNLGMAFNVMADEFFRTVNSEDYIFSLGEAWMVFLVYGLVCLYMLWRKVRAYEVISS